MNYYGYPYIALTGGADGALDSLDGSLLKNGDFAVVVLPTVNTAYIYTLDDDSGASESSPDVIAPDSNAGDKRWVLANYGTTISAGVSASGINFLQEGTGAVTRTALSKMQDVVDVYDFLTTAERADVYGRTGAVDVTAKIQAALDYVATEMGAGLVYARSGVYKTTATLTIGQSGVALVGEMPKATVFAPNFDTDPFITFDSASLMERVGLYNCEIAHSITRTTGATIQFGRGYRMYCQDVEVTGAKIGVAYGTAGHPGETIDGHLVRVRLNTSDDGIYCTGQVALFIENCRLNGTPTNGSKGINLVGAQDGLWVDHQTTIEEHDTSFYISHTSGSVANIFLNGCALDRPITAAFRVALSGTAAINGVYIDGVKIYDTVGSGNTDGILVDNSGSGGIDGLELRNISARDLRQRFANFNAVVTNLVIQNCCSLRGGVKTVDTYAGIDFQELAHDHVIVTGNRIGSSHNYGMIDGVNITNLIVTGNDFSDNDTGSQNNMGSTSASRVIDNNI